jgi:AhpD family alkylhydroperoxidase
MTTSARTESARIGPGSRKEVGLATWILAAVTGRFAGTDPLNLFLVLGRHRRLFRAWLRFAGRLMPRGLLPRRETELAILRVAHLRGCRYEFEHHVRLGRRAGVTDDDMARVLEGPVADGWTARERVVLATVDSLHHSRNLDDASWARLRTHLDDRETIELCLLVGHYEMLATTIAALRIPPDRIRKDPNNSAQKG